jgi:CYTH domain-containing protein
MNIEIERKFLLKALPIKTPIDRIKINQWYRKNSKEIWERARSCYSDEKGIYFIHTVKNSVKIGVNEEIERDLTAEEFNFFVKKCKESSEARYIFKERLIYPHNKDGLIWEVDVFQNEHHLIVAEIELPTEDYKLKLPKFIKDNLLMEVTHLSQFSNKNLSNNVKTKKKQIKDLL